MDRSKERYANGRNRFYREGSVGFNTDEREYMAEESDDNFTEDDEPVEEAEIPRKSNIAGGTLYEAECAQEYGSATMVDKYIHKSASGENWLILLKKNRVLIVILAIVFGILVCYNNSMENINISTTKSKEDFAQHLRTIKKEFPSQKDMFWKSIFQKIVYINESRPVRPAVIVLSHNGTRKVAECLAWKVGRAASRFLNTPDITELIGNRYMTEMDNELVGQYKPLLQRNSVLIVYRLNEIPALVAKSFHSFCDTYNPLVNRALILFTLDNRCLEQLQGDGTSAPNKRVSEILRSLWKDSLIDSTLNSLITRITDTVLEVYSEENVLCPN